MICSRFIMVSLVNSTTCGLIKLWTDRLTVDGIKMSSEEEFTRCLQIWARVLRRR